MPAAWSPRSYLEDPTTFGRRPKWTAVVEPAVWHPFDGDEVRLAAAYLQHRAARAVTDAIQAGQVTLEALAAHVGESEDYVRSKLHGHRPISIEDLLQWAQLVGVDVIPPLDVSAFEQLLPPLPGP